MRKSILNSAYTGMYGRRYSGKIITLYVSVFPRCCDIYRFGFVCPYTCHYFSVREFNFRCFLKERFNQFTGFLLGYPGYPHDFEVCFSGVLLV